MGPPPVPMEALSVERLTDGFRLLRRSRYREAAARLARQMAAEDGVQVLVFVPLVQVLVVVLVRGEHLYIVRACAW